MKTLKFSLVALIALVGLVSTIAIAAQVDPDTYKTAGSTYGRSDGMFTNSAGDLHVIVNGSTTSYFDSTLSGLITPTNTIATGETLTEADCGKVHLVTAAVDTATITLPATIDGCVMQFMYTGADGGALVDISPNAADAVHGSCTLAASVLEFNGTDDNDIGLTKATANTGDTITLAGDGSAGWYVLACAGIWANN